MIYILGILGARAAEHTAPWSAVWFACVVPLFVASVVSVLHRCLTLHIGMALISTAFFDLVVEATTSDCLSIAERNQWTLLALCALSCVVFNTLGVVRSGAETDAESQRRT